MSHQRTSNCLSKHWKVSDDQENYCVVDFNDAIHSKSAILASWKISFRAGITCGRVQQKNVSSYHSAFHSDLLPIGHFDGCPTRILILDIAFLQEWFLTHMGSVVPGSHHVNSSVISVIRNALVPRRQSTDEPVGTFVLTGSFRLIGELLAIGATNLSYQTWQRINSRRHRRSLHDITILIWPHHHQPERMKEALYL